MTNIFLSFVITTRNKKAMLAEMLESLVASRQDDEEIIIIDSLSTDGTAEYLSSLQKKGAIDFFASESDVGEAHGFNKAICRARGQYIKVLSDDDVYDWSLVRQIKDWLKVNPVDVCFTNGLTSSRMNNVMRLDYRKEFVQWKLSGEPFAFCGLGLFIRNDALPLVGYFSTLFKRVDAEYSLRLTAMRSKVTLGFSPQYVWFRRLNPSSNSVRYRSAIRNEMIMLLLMNTGLAGLIRWSVMHFFNQRNAVIDHEINDTTLTYSVSLDMLAVASKMTQDQPLCLSSSGPDRHGSLV